MNQPGNQNLRSAKYTESKFDTLPDGTRDYLKVDPPIPGQNWVCMSFVSPEEMIKRRDLYYFNQFLYTEINKTLRDQSVHMAKEVNNLLRDLFEKRIEKLESSINEQDNELGYRLKSIYKGLEFDENEFAGRCMHLYRQDYNELHDKFDMYKVQNQTEMDRKFDAENDYQCSVRGFKVRGVYNHRKEADEKAKELREQVEPVHVFMAPVGHWCPWDPHPDSVQDSDYMLPALNELMGKYHQNVRQKNKFFEERKQEMQEDAQKSNRDRIKQRLRQKLLERKQKEMQNKRIADQAETQTENPEDLEKLLAQDWVQGDKKKDKKDKKDKKRRK